MSIAKRALNIGNRINKIPDEIMEQILLLVPVEDLANFKTFWFSIITNHRFIYSKLKFDWPRLSLASSCFTTPNLLTILERRGKLILTLHRPLQYPNHDSTLICWKKIKYTIHDKALNVQKKSKGNTWLWSHFESDATCMHGLICFHNKFRSVYICNPLTREFITSPKTKHNALLHCGRMLRLLATGFGFCSSINKYKIVHVCVCHCEDHDSINPQIIHKRAEVLTVGDDKSWRRMKLWEGPCHPIKKALIIDNVMYWKTAWEEDFVIRFVTFDICKEEFKVIEVSVPGFQPHSPYELIELEGKLCIVQEKYENGDGTNFFVPENINELGEGWIMKHRLQFHPRTGGLLDNYNRRVPIGIISNNIYAMKSICQEMKYFDFRTGQLLRCERQSGPYKTRNLLPYVPSLVPILPS